MNERTMHGRWTRHLKRTAWIGVLGLVVMTALPQGSARAQDDDDDGSIWNLDKRIIKGFAKGLGLQRGDTPGIDYRERSPLVIPPTRDLPPPVGGDPALRNPSWPRDPDRRVVTRTKAKANARSTSEDPGSESALTPDELRRGTNPRAPRVTDPSQTTGSLEDANVGRQMSPKELNSSGIFNWNALMGTHLNDTAKFEQEPSRNALTQPPPGYQTPSPSQPYGAGKEGSGWKIPSILDRPIGQGDQ
jgi:hypothetical protein